MKQNHNFLFSIKKNIFVTKTTRYFEDMYANYTRFYQQPLDYIFIKPNEYLSNRSFSFPRLNKIQHDYNNME